MELLQTLAPSAYEHAWNLSLKERLSMLAQGRYRVAYYYPQGDTGTFRYRAYNMVQVLNEQPQEVSSAYFFHADLTRIDDIAASANMLVVCRARYEYQVARLIEHFKKQGKKVLFDIDDLAFNTDYAHLLMQSLDVNFDDPAVWDNWFAYISRLGQTMRMCHGAIATGSLLAQRITEFVDFDVRIIPNFLNREQTTISKAVLKAKQALASQCPVAQRDALYLGYFSGTASHNRDFALIGHALKELLATHRQWRLALVGHIDPPSQLLDFSDRIDRYPFQDYVNLQRLIGAVDINLMPLQCNAFTECKSELKYFEAAAVGTLGVASPVGSFATAIHHGRTGWLAQLHQWTHLLEQAMSEVLQPRLQITQQALQDAHFRYGWQAQRSSILSALGLI
jgi:glycosyltransferase involved in cell wall biosynthesis